MRPRPSSREFFEEWLADVPQAVRGWELEPVAFELGVAGRAQPRERGGGARGAWSSRASIAPTAEAALASFAGVGRRFELVGERGGVQVIDDYGHNPTEIAATLRTARELEPRTLIAVYQPHVYERTRQLHHELGDALGLADATIVTDVIDGRDAPLPGVTGKLVLDQVPRGVAPRLGARLSTMPRRSRSLGCDPATSSSRSGSASLGEIARAIVDGLPA